MEDIITTSNKTRLVIGEVQYPTYFWYVEVVVQDGRKAKKPTIVLECTEEDIEEKFSSIHEMLVYFAKHIAPDEQES